MGHPIRQIIFLLIAALITTPSVTYAKIDVFSTHSYAFSFAMLLLLRLLWYGESKLYSLKKMNVSNNYGCLLVMTFLYCSYNASLGLNDLASYCLALVMCWAGIVIASAVAVYDEYKDDVVWFSKDNFLKAWPIHSIAVVGLAIGFAIGYVGMYVTLATVGCLTVVALLFVYIRHARRKRAEQVADALNEARIERERREAEELRAQKEARIERERREAEELRAQK
ncbi:MAG: hypothetical protein WCJ02_07730, partial [bacterium]